MKSGIIILLNLLLIISCGDPDCKDSSADHLFEIPIDVSPRNDTLRIGDTITVVSTFSSNVFDRNNGKEFLLENFKFYPFFYLNIVDKEPPEGLMSENTLLIDAKHPKNITNHSTGRTSLTTEYYFDDNSYAIKFQVVLEKTGLAFFSAGSDLGHRFTPDQNFPGKCDKSNMSVYFKMGNEQTENNHEFLLNDGISTYQMTKDQFEKFGGYCFYVAE